MEVAAKVVRLLALAHLRRSEAAPHLRRPAVVRALEEARGQLARHLLVAHSRGLAKPEENLVVGVEEVDVV